MSKLMIIAQDRVSEWISKGEVTRRYYNPGNLFEEVHLVMLNNDQPDLETLQKLVGSARIFVHSFPTGIPFFAATLGWNRILLKPWIAKIVALAQSIGPSLIRCHAAGLNSYVASQIKKSLGVPYVVSLHINPDENIRTTGRSVPRKIRDAASETLEIESLRSANRVLPVYRPIVPYLDRIGVQNFEVAYNALNPDYLAKKTDYQIHSPVRVISVGRQFKEKDPSELMRAVAELPNVELTLVGNGTHHEALKSLAQSLPDPKRFKFFPSLPNDQLCQMLPDFDIFATHTEYWELSKSVLEPLLTGLPVLLNRRIGQPVPELTPEICILIENKKEAYRSTLAQLISDQSLREKLGREAFRHARENWGPDKTEAKFVKIYKEILATSPRVVGRATCSRA